MNRSPYAISYFHINDLLKERYGIMRKDEYEAYFREPGTFVNRMKPP